MISWIISKIKKEEYNLSYNFSFIELCLILSSKFIEITRGFIKYKLRMRYKGLLFAKKGSKICFKHKIKSGKNMALGRYSKIMALSIYGVEIGDNFMLGDFAIIECTGVLRAPGNRLIIGNDVAINHYCFIGVRGEVLIGNNVIFGPRVTVLSENHNFDDLDMPIKHQGETRFKTVIEDNVWIGANAIIMPGVTIKEGSVIGSGAVVTKDTDVNSVMVGIPAKMIKKRGYDRP